VPWFLRGKIARCHRGNLGGDFIAGCWVLALRNPTTTDVYIPIPPPTHQGTLPLLRLPHLIVTNHATDLVTSWDLRRGMPCSTAFRAVAGVARCGDKVPVLEKPSGDQCFHGAIPPEALFATSSPPAMKWSREEMAETTDS
jgi:hypothetical protein